MLETRHCSHCERNTHQELSKKVLANNKVLVGWWCDGCCNWSEPKNQNGYWIEHDKIIGCDIDIDSLRIVSQNLTARCARCGIREGELHHWAPKSVFEDADDWPQDYLCVECHKEWHIKTGVADGHYR